MSHARKQSVGETPREPHSVSLKVLRLSRPTLSQQFPLTPDDTPISQKASLSYPTSDDAQFIYSPNLNLPASFGSAYVGETISCALCANNEVLYPSPSTNNSIPKADSSSTLLSPQAAASAAVASSAVQKTISSIRIIAEMQTPSQQISLDLLPPTSEDTSPEPQATIQKVIRFDLKEEGPHILAVSISYTESSLPSSSSSPSNPPTSPTAPKTRTFRKLYQFLAQPCLSVRTKATELPPLSIPIPQSLKSPGDPYAKLKVARFVMEAQLENVGDAGIVLERTEMVPRGPFTVQGLNWDIDIFSDEDETEEENEDDSKKDPKVEDDPSNQITTTSKEQQQQLPYLQPRETLQLAFLLSQSLPPTLASALPQSPLTSPLTSPLSSPPSSPTPKSPQHPSAEHTIASVLSSPATAPPTKSTTMLPPLKRDDVGRVVLGQLAIQWRGPMGVKGYLSTGNLMSRRR